MKWKPQKKSLCKCWNPTDSHLLYEDKISTLIIFHCQLHKSRRSAPWGLYCKYIGIFSNLQECMPMIMTPEMYWPLCKPKIKPLSLMGDAIQCNYSPLSLLCEVAYSYSLACRYISWIWCVLSVLICWRQCPPQSEVHAYASLLF